MGFKITHPPLPSRLLVWPPWHTSTWRLHVPPDRISGTSDTTKWPQCLHFHFVLSVFLISSLRLPHLEGECLFHTFLIFQGGCFKPVDKKYSPLVHSSCFCIQSCFSFYAPECLLISISVWMSLHLRPPRLSFLRCILFIILLNWFSSIWAYAFSRLIALLD